MKLIRSDEITDYIQNHVEETYPDECCGFFFGEDGEERIVTYVQRVANAKEGDQRRRFRIDPKDYRKAEAYADENGLDFLGIYHSHPDHPAEPSEHDRKVAMPFFSYIILSVQNGRTADIRSWRLNDERQFEEEPVEARQLVDDKHV